MSSSNLVYSTLTPIPPYKSYIPDPTPATIILPTAGAGNSWRLTKAAGVPGNNTRYWLWPYNPQFGNAPPYSAPPVTFLKKNLNSLWARIRVKTSAVNGIATQGALFFNIYTYDYGTAPTQAYSTRFDYSANNLALPLTTGTLTLQTDFEYLVYAFDAPKIVANPAAPGTITEANGQVAGQLTSEMLRDPFDIYTNIPHIPFGAVAYANGAVVPSNIVNVPVLSLSFGTTSSTLTNGADIELLSVGYSANGGTINEEIVLNYV